MILLETVAEILETAGLGQLGESMFLYNMPHEKTSGILLIEDLDGTERDEYMPGYSRTSFRVIVRHTEPKSAMTVAKDVASALDFHWTTVNGLAFKRMRPTHEPIAFPMPDSDVIEVLVKVWAAYVVA